MTDTKTQSVKTTPTPTPKMSGSELEMSIKRMIGDAKETCRKSGGKIKIKF